MLLLVWMSLSASCSRPPWPLSDHFDGRTFHSTPRVQPPPWDVLKWRLQGGRAAWPKVLDVQRVAPSAEVVRGMDATWIGHATVLVQTPGFHFLTDPHWGDRAGPFSWAGPRRKAAPAVEFDSLPRIDAVLVSHDHYDHLDMPTLRRLARRGGAVGVAGLGTAGLLRKAGFDRVVELDWWQTEILPTGDTVTLVPARHWGMRWPWDRGTRLWGGFVVGTRAGRIYYAGDTGEGPHFKEIGTRFPGIDLALIPIGAHLPRWFMAPQHIGPEEALGAARDLGARTSLAIHWGTFHLANDGPTQAADTLAALLAADATAPEFRILPIGSRLQVSGRDPL